MKKTSLLALLAVGAGLTVSASLFAQSPAPARRNLVVCLRGTAVGQMRDIPPIAGTGTSQANCFDVSLVDPATNRVIGTATDCLADIQPFGEGLVLTGTTFFNFPEGTIVSRGRTTVQPVGSPSAATHITGAIPSAGSNDILSGTGAYQNLQGRVRLSGAVNMSRLNSNNEITFDCLFIIEPSNR